MLRKLADVHPTARQLLTEASDILGQDLWAHYSDDNPEVFATNRDVQVGVFLANHLYLELLHDRGVYAAGSLGLSLGEWNHLVHIGAVSFADALCAIDVRGRAYDTGPRGMMAAVFPLDLAELEPLLDKARDESGAVVEAVNLNSPTQNVIAGDTEAVELALRLIEDETFARGVVIEKHVPMHCSTFAEVGERFREHLEGVSFRTPVRPYLPNRLGELIENPRRELFVDLLATHVHMPVLWRDSIDRALERWPEATIVEVGPKQVLTGMLGRKWHRGVEKLHTDAEKDGDLGIHLAGVVDLLTRKLAA